MLRVAFAFENRVAIGTEDLPAAVGGKKWVKRNRTVSTEVEGGLGCGKDDGSRTDNFEAGTTIGLVDGGKRAVRKEWPGSFEFSVGQAAGWVEVGLVGD